MYVPLLSPTVFTVSGWWLVYFLEYLLFNFNTIYRFSTIRSQKPAPVCSSYSNFKELVDCIC